MVKIILLAALEQSQHFKMTADFIKLLHKKVRSNKKIYAVLQYLPDESNNNTKILVHQGAGSKEIGKIIADLNYYAANFKFITFRTSIYTLLRKLNDIEIINGDTVYVVVVDFRRSGGCFAGGEKNYFINEIIDKVSKDANNQPLSNVQPYVRLIYSNNCDKFSGYSDIESMIEANNILSKKVNFETKGNPDIREWVDFVLGNNH